MKSPANKDLLKTIQDILMLEAEGITQMAHHLTPAIKDAVALCLSCEGRIIVSGMGKSGHIARKIAATLSSTGSPAQFVHPAEAGHGDLGMVTKKDCIIALSNSGETEELIPLITHAKRFGIPLIAMVKGDDNTLGRTATVTMALPPLQEACPLGLAPTTSSTVMLALGDALALTLLQCKGFTKEDFANIHPGGALGAQLLRVGDIMHKGDEIPLAPADMTMSQALILMTQKHFGCLGIINRQTQLIGIVTDGDLRRHMDEQLLTKKLKDIMTPDPHIVSDSMLASQALALMNEKEITSLFVQNDSHPKRAAGIVHIHDCLRAGIS